MADPQEYVLGTQDDELERLGFQNRLWADAAHGLWRRARIRLGERVLDVGSGPGFAAFDLAQLVGSAGRVVGVDASSAFVDALDAGARARGLPWCSGLVADVQALGEVPGGPFDLAWARWVLCFAPEPEAVVAGIAANLRPGGRLAVHDYFNYEAMTLAPRRETYTAVVAATAASWRERGADPDVVARLPAILRRQGYSLDHLAVHQRIARPGDSMWQWASTWWHNFVPRLVGMGRVSPGLAERFFADLAAATRSEDDFVVLPPVFEVLATRR